MQGMWQLGRIRVRGLVHVLGYDILLLKVQAERELVYISFYQRKFRLEG